MENVVKSRMSLKRFLFEQNNRFVLSEFPIMEERPKIATSKLLLSANVLCTRGSAEKMARPIDIAGDFMKKNMLGSIVYNR